jgi:hypothetical protein
MTSSQSNDGGQVTVLVLGLAIVAFAVAGVAIDGTRAFLFRRTLQNAADAAALAGAGELDRAAYYGSGGERVLLDARAARAKAAEWLERRGLDVRAGIDADAAGVRVVLRGRLTTTFLRLVGVGTVPVAAEARASPATGAP